MMPPLRLAVDARVVAQDTRGIGRYARAILRRLAIRDDVALTLLAEGLFPARRRAAFARALGIDAFDVRGRVPRDAQLVWHPANGTFFESSAPSVATIHDAVPFRYPNPDAARRAHDQQPFLRSARSAARVVAVSEFGAGQLHQLLGIAREKIDVILHGVDASFSPGIAEPLPPALQGDRAYILFVGDPIAEPRKNFDLLYDAYQRAWPGADGPLLAIIGPQAPLAAAGVVHVGELGDDLVANGNAALRACYRGALALALASYHETFGMPMLEAMACGTPVLASRAGSLPEIGADAPLFLPSDDADAWAKGLQRVADDAALRERLQSAGLTRAGEFSWEKSAARHYQLFCSVAL